MHLRMFYKLTNSKKDWLLHSVCALEALEHSKIVPKRDKNHSLPMLWHTIFLRIYVKTLNVVAMVIKFFAYVVFHKAPGGVFH